MCIARARLHAGPRRPWRRVAPWLLALLAALWSAFAPAAGFTIEHGSPHLVWKAELVVAESALPPSDDAAWQAVALPDSWRKTGRWHTGRDGWYRIHLPGPAPAEPTSVYLWRFSMNAAVWFNGQFVGDGGSFDEPVARNWNRPLLFSLPAAMWRDGENLLLVRLRTYPGFGHLMPVAVGPTALLQPEYEQRWFAQVTLSQVAGGITLLALLTGVLLWWVERGDAALPWFIAFCGVWFVYGANTYVRDIPVAAKTWWWAVHSAIDASYWLIVCMFHRLVGVRRPRIERLLLGWALLCSLLYALWELPQLARWNPQLHALSALAGLYLCAWLLLRANRRRSVEFALFAAIFITMFAAGVHDQLLNALVLPALWRTRFLLLHLVMPLMFLGLIALLALRAARGVRAVREANLQLESRVEAASAQIASAHARERALESERIAALERERIYRDLHDNLGARLLSLVYGARDEHQAALARQALAEMRALIASSQLPGATLAELAGDWKLETELRCEDAGVQLDWRVQGDARLSGQQRYQLERLLRELVSNALEHGRGRNLSVLLQATAGELRLELQDDGSGVDGGTALEGHGIAGVRERAGALGGAATWHRGSAGGTCCSVRFPLQGSAGAP